MEQARSGRQQGARLGLAGLLAVSAAILCLALAWHQFTFQSWFFGMLAFAQALYVLGLRMPRANLRAYVSVGAQANLFVLGAFALARLVASSAFDANAEHVHTANVEALDLLAVHWLIVHALLVLVLVRLFVNLPSENLAPQTSRRALMPVLVLMFALTACVSSSQTPDAAPTVGPGPTAEPTAHEADEGLPLGSNDSESVYKAALCPATAKVREYSVVAIHVDITLNRYLDHDPQGLMYVLENELPRVRQEETQNQAARAGTGEPAVSPGLQGDAIQPLVLRVNQGECLRITLKNALEGSERASLHLHGSGLHMARTGMPAIANNPDSMVNVNAAATYEWMVEADEPEGTHYFHSHGDDRNQTNHGLFGAVVVERQGSVFIDPLTGNELHSGWSALIKPGLGSAFREFAIFYHEIGNEAYRPLDKGSRLIPQVDPYTDAYKPGSRAINYRSEPFMNRLALQQQESGFFDKSQAYSSYAFGDPATPVARSYLGDPVKQRVIHGGAEVFHVHHVHGGAIRWRVQPGEESTGFDSGLTKHPALLPQASERVDSQSIGPSETYDVEDECGSGGCQQSVGDFLIHCHVANHYLAGMWMIWRVYNTKQNGAVSQDMLPPLQELPDRQNQVVPAVMSDALAGRMVDWKGKTFQVTAENLSEWVERMLPPQGTPIGYDAAVLDWRKDGNRYLNEPESSKVWPGFKARTPNVRLPFYFDPITGKLAYPQLRPHLGKRPPFAPNHGPAPFLEPIRAGTDPSPPGANGPWSLCPADTHIKSFMIDAISVAVNLNKAANILDPSGTLFVLKDHENAVLSNDSLKIPLAIRANAGEDCVDVLLRSALPDDRTNNFFSKVDIHIHFVQFDVQASDGVNTGFNYEQSVRPFTVEGEHVVERANAGASSIQLGAAKRFQAGVLVGVGMEQDKSFEVKRITAVEGSTLLFDSPLSFAHAAGEIVSTEFVRYRWYPDVQFGTAYFHDHVDALHSWRHGLFGALIAEPPRSTYLDPHTGAQLASGPLADIHTDAKVSADVSGSFREMVMFIQDDNPLTRLGNSSGSSLNLRVEPLALRNGDPAQLFNSSLFGDPATPLLEAFVGDPLVVRTLVGGTNDVHTWHLDGHWFRQELQSLSSPPINTIHLGISERFDLAVPSAGGPQRRPGDYLYYSGRVFKLREGSWGILRVYDGAAGATLLRLPGHEANAQAAPPICPPKASIKTFEVAAMESNLPMLTDANAKGKMYVLQDDEAAVRNGALKPEPLVLHVNVGDCLKVHLRNDMPSGAVSFHADLLSFDPLDSYGVAAGNDPAQAVAPGDTRTYTYYAHPEVGETTALIRDWGDVLSNPRLGLYGAIVVGARGAAFTDPLTGQDLSRKSSWRADVHPASGRAYRDFTLFMQDEDPIIGTALMPYTAHVQGVAGLNYLLEPLAQRLQKNSDTSKVFRSDVHGDPSTPLLEAYAGDEVKVHVLVPYSEQAHVFTIENHEWPLEPGRGGSALHSSFQAGALETLTVVLDSAGGREKLPGDYIYGDHREPFREVGLWGLFRVYPNKPANSKLKPL